MVWPDHGRNLIPGVNDTWNEFQSSHKGKKQASVDWKAARSVLYAQHDEFIANGGVPLSGKDIVCRSVVVGYPNLGTCVHSTQADF
jgi:hypothetical protein